MFGSVNCVERRAIDLFVTKDYGWRRGAGEVILGNIGIDVVDGLELGGMRGFVWIRFKP